MVTQRGIEANPAQLKAILQSPAPGSKKGIQQLTDWLAALGRFISRFADRLKTFFTTLRGVNRAEWNEECDQAFVAIKQYLTEPPILVSSKAGDTRYLYLAASNVAVSGALFKECGDARLRLVFSCQLVGLPGLPEGQFTIFIFQCLVSIFDTGSLYSFKAKVLRVLLQLESPKSEHRNSRYVQNNSDYSMIKTDAGIGFHMAPL